MNAFLFKDVLSAELGLVLAVHAGPAVGADAAGALAARPELVLEITFPYRPFRLQLLCGQVCESVLLDNF